jgi:3-dehydroquinate dehydratase-2
MRILLINGPNLNLLGTREPDIYGTLTLADIVGRVKARASELGVEIADFQSNIEGEIVEFIQREAPNADGAIINAAALTHYSLALHDVINATGLKVIEVHISNIHAREEFRHHSVIAGIAIGQVAGLGWRGYIAALDALVGILKEKQK